MSPEDVARVAGIAFSRFRDRDFEAAAELCAEDLELLDVPTGDLFQGREGFLQHARGWAAAFPDASVDILRIASGESTAAVELDLLGTHTGTLISSHGHVPPTWSRVLVRFCYLLDVRDGAIVRATVYFDSGGLLRQMGLLPNSPLHPADRRASLELYALETDASAQQRKKTVLSRYLDEVFNQHQPDLVAEFCVPNLAWHGGPLGELRDVERYGQQLANLFAAFPDLALVAEEIVAERDLVWARLAVTGTHRGPFFGTSPTGRRVSASATCTCRLVDGRVAEEWWQIDLYGIMRQLDLLPPLVRLPGGRQR